MRIERLTTIVHHVDALYRDTYYKRNKYRQLITERLASSDLGKSEKYYLNCFLSSEYMYIEKWPEAESCLLYALNLFPFGKTMAYSYLSQLYYLIGQYDKSLKLSIEMIDNVKRGNKYAWFNIARNKCKKGMYEEAENDLYEFIKYFPDSPTGYFNFAYIQYLLNSPYDKMLAKAFEISEMIGNPDIYEKRTRSIYQGECIVFDFTDDFINRVIEDISRKSV